MSNDINFQVHTSSDTIPIPNTYDNSVNNTDFFPLFILLSITNLENISRDPENTTIILDRVFRENEILTRDPNKELQLSTQSFNTTTMKFDECSICTECFEPEDAVSVLECSHIFHTKCIQEWGHYNASCPICKNNIPVQKKDILDIFRHVLASDGMNDID